jgi:hypothetical protein
MVDHDAVQQLWNQLHDGSCGSEESFAGWKIALIVLGAVTGFGILFVFTWYLLWRLKLVKTLHCKSKNKAIIEGKSINKVQVQMQEAETNPDGDPNER